MCIVCVYVFSAFSKPKRGHRKTASFGNILDVPEIVKPGIACQLCESIDTDAGVMTKPLNTFCSCSWVIDYLLAKNN